MTVSTEQLDALAELAGRATRPPWVWHTSNSWRRLKHDSRGLTMNVLEPFVARDGHPDLTISEDDMAFIAAAREAVPALIDTIRSLQAEREKLLAAVAWLDEPFVGPSTSKDEMLKRIRFMREDIARSRLSSIEEGA